MEHQGNKTRLSVFWGFPGTTNRKSSMTKIHWIIPSWCLLESKFWSQPMFEIQGRSVSCWPNHEGTAEEWRVKRDQTLEEKPGFGQQKSFDSSLPHLSTASCKNPGIPHPLIITMSHTHRFTLCCCPSCDYTFLLAFISVTFILFIYIPLFCFSSML